MENLLIPETEKTPLVDFNSNSGNLLLKGKMIPEDVFKFFSSITEWGAAYLNNPAPITKIEIDIPYMNTLSTTKTLHFLKQLMPLKQNHKSLVTVVWKYESFDTDMYECGLNFQKITGFHFEYVTV